MVPGGSEGKASACNAGDLGLIPGSGRSPGEGSDNPLQYSCLEKSHGQRSLVDYSPWDRKESDTTERLHFLSLSLSLVLTGICSVSGRAVFISTLLAVIYLYVLTFWIRFWLQMANLSTDTHASAKITIFLIES